MGVLLLFTFLLRCAPTSAQTFQTLPEVDAYSTIQPNIRFNFQVKETREAGDPTQAEIGPGFDFYIKPLARLKGTSDLDPNKAKSHLVLWYVGFRYLPSPDKPHVERVELAGTAHYPFIAKILLSDRSRADLDWSQNRFTWRYRNRLTLERRVTIGSYHPAPYLSAEFFYQGQFQKWGTTALYAGCLFPIGKHIEFDPYYEHQNITTVKPNQQLNQFGLILNLYY
jgi:hypothetical protein